MENDSTTRKLAAILSADVKEYSRLMGQDERGTIRTLTAYKEAISGLIEEYRGRVVDAPGDNLLAEFGSVVDQVLNHFYQANPVSEDSGKTGSDYDLDIVLLESTFHQADSFTRNGFERHFFRFVHHTPNAGEFE